MTPTMRSVGGASRWPSLRLVRRVAIGFLVVSRALLEINEPKNQTTHMKINAVIMSVLVALAVSSCSTVPDSPTLQHTLTVTPEIKKAFHGGDSIKIRSVTGTSP